MQLHGKISFVLPFFGEPPAWLPFFLQTCKSNPGIEWIFFSDFALPGNRPANVHWHESSLDEIRKRASRQLNMGIALNHPYKLTDLKPAYGLIFQDHLSSSTHWGYCDLDLVWGKFSHFLDEKTLTEFDIVSGGKDFLPGHMLILKNQCSNNNLFRQSRNWRQIFADPRCFSFDEILRRKPFLPAEESIRNAVGSDVRKHLEKTLRKRPGFPLATRTRTAQTLTNRTLTGRTLVGRTFVGRTRAAQTLTNRTLAGRTLVGRTRAAQTLTDRTLAGRTLVGRSLAARTRAAKTLFVRSKQSLRLRKPVDFNSVIRQAELKGTLKVKMLDGYRDDVFQLLEGRDRFLVTWDKGVLSEGERELLYYHFQLSKYEEDFKFELLGKDRFQLSGKLIR